MSECHEEWLREGRFIGAGVYALDIDMLAGIHRATCLCINHLAFWPRSANLRGVTLACLAKPCGNVNVILFVSMSDKKHGGRGMRIA